MKREDLETVLNQHVAWVRSGRKEGKRADLRGVDLQGTDLQGVDLQDANLRGVDLRGANLQRADLQGTDLRNAYIRHANLQRANLPDADLLGVDLLGADLHDAILPDYQHLPDTGSFLCYKKVMGDVILTLFVPRDAMRTSCLRSNKCRVSRAKVTASSDTTQTEWKNMQLSVPTTWYRLGQWVEPDGYDDDIRKDCTNGIHVFKTCKEAEAF